MEKWFDLRAKNTLYGTHQPQARRGHTVHLTSNANLQSRNYYSD